MIDTITIKEIQEKLMNMADNMAAAAASFSSHGYDAFIGAREAFKSTVEEAIKEVKENNDQYR